MTLIPADMNALLGSRICHDLISPLGAIGNGIELLQMSGLANSAELSLISESVDHANARIRLFRVAFGAAAEGQMISGSELRTILDAVGPGQRIEVDWHPAHEMPRRTARLIMLLILCAETLLPWGGQVRVANGDGAAVTMIAERMRDVPELLRQLDDDEADLPQASEIQFTLARHAARESGRRLIVENDVDGASGGLVIRTDDRSDLSTA